ncbi:hypothetical protein WJX84_007459 [Apatococcus fuscideae]|uniref:Purple acid phosphatase n=1 Tax=Apatococcus fuscideae TaxID=2026836 RepID=A0AAW1SW80_9CHLO
MFDAAKVLSLAVCCTLVTSTLAISTTLQGPQAQISNPLNTMLYQRGAADLPMSDPRFVQTVTGVYPEQVHLGYASPDSMFVSWATGEAQISATVSPLDPTSVKTVVTYGSSPGSYSGNVTGYGLVYNQYYNIPAKNNTPAALNYTSGIQHHAKITGLTPNTTYFYRCGDPTIPAWSDEYNFTTSPAVGPNSFPMTLGVIADLGMTSNSTSTWEHLVANQPPSVILIGDYTYANNYITNGTGASSYSTTFPGITSQSYQPRWDGFQRWLQPYLQSHAFLGIEGNHEQEPNINGVQFQSYLARYQAPGVESGSNTTLYYSFDMGPAHVVMLGSYVDYGKNSSQYQWLVNDLAKFNRANTPWLIAMWHPPVYNSYVSHYKDESLIQHILHACLALCLERYSSICEKLCI